MDQVTASKLKGRIWLSLCQMSSTSPTAKAGTENMQWCLVPRVNLSVAMWLSLHSQGQTKENRLQRLLQRWKEWKSPGEVPGTCGSDVLHLPEELDLIR